MVGNIFSTAQRGQRRSKRTQRKRPPFCGTLYPQLNRTCSRKHRICTSERNEASDAASETYCIPREPEGRVHSTPRLLPSKAPLLRAVAVAAMARNSQAPMAHANGRTRAGHTRTTKGTKAERGAAPKKKKKWEHGLGKNGRWTAVQTPPPKLREWSRFENRELSRDSTFRGDGENFPVKNLFQMSPKTIMVFREDFSPV